MFMIKMFKLPVDFCGVSFPDNLYSQVVSTVCVRSCATPGADYTLCCCQECLEINPIHSYPWLLVYEAGEWSCTCVGIFRTDVVHGFMTGEAQPLSINGSEAIITFLVQQYRDMIPDSFYSKSPAKAAVMMQVSCLSEHSAFSGTHIANGVAESVPHSRNHVSRNHVSVRLRVVWHDE